MESSLDILLEISDIEGDSKLLDLDMLNELDDEVFMIGAKNENPLSLYVYISQGPLTGKS